MRDNVISVTDAKARLDRLIGKTRAHLYKPIGIAELLYRHRVKRNIDLNQPAAYRRKAYHWCREVCHTLYGRRPDLNSRYWDQLFDSAVLPPEALCVLGRENRRQFGIVETYIYGHILGKVSGILEIVASVRSCKPKDFELSQFLRKFEHDQRFRRSVDKAYEIVVYALFNTVTRHLDATVTLSVANKGDLLIDFEEFAKMVLGVDRVHPQIQQPARLYRVGTANAADAGLDMWANFGPAVQVKHLSLSPERCGGICDSLQADHIVIVCKSVEAPSIEALLRQVGLRKRIRGIITEIELSRWYTLACSSKYCSTLGQDLLRSILDEMALEFPLTQAERVCRFMTQRRYDVKKLVGAWAVRAGMATDDSEE